MGCKVVEFIRKAAEELKKGFTLTMWDVKFFTIVKLPVSIVSFTLTMWDVKRIDRINDLVEKYVLP